MNFSVSNRWLLFKAGFGLLSVLGATIGQVHGFQVNSNNPVILRHRQQQTRLSRLRSNPEGEDGDVHKQLEETKQIMDRQQEQIDKLLDLMRFQQQQPKDQSQHQNYPNNNYPVMHSEPPQVMGSSSSSSSATSSVTPLKVMLFVDGTWLYYSIHEREKTTCPIKHKFGNNWQRHHKVDWAGLPRVVAQNLHDPGWTSSEEQLQQHMQRPIEIVRVLVFTSFKADTPTKSYRYRMFQEMLAANYDVSMLETVGRGEKCVDIQLAVEMLHYATVPGAYDVALVLTGDKDFSPAMIRTRQKARKVGLVSMKMGCNRALHDTPGIKDYDVVWLDDHLDEIIIPKKHREIEREEEELSISRYTLAKIIADFVKGSGDNKVTSRDLGRYLKYLRFGESTVLGALKQEYRSMKAFIDQMPLFRFLQMDDNRQQDIFYISADVDAVQEQLRVLAASTQINPVEENFWKTYSTEILKDTARVYQNSMFIQGTLSLPSAIRTEDYSSHKVAELKELCRKHSLPVSGTKAVLVDRVQNFMDKKTAKQTSESDPEVVVLEHLGGQEYYSTGNFDLVKAKKSRTPVPLKLISRNLPRNPEAEKFLSDVIAEFVRASHGSARSRKLGRYLSKHTSSDGRKSALVELKGLYGSLGTFIKDSKDFISESTDTANVFLIKFSPRGRYSVTM